MHRSRMYAVLLDVPPPARAAATAFRSAALGTQPRDVLLCVIPVHRDPAVFAATARTWTT